MPGGAILRWVGKFSSVSEGALHWRGTTRVSFLIVNLHIRLLMLLCGSYDERACASEEASSVSRPYDSAEEQGAKSFPPASMC